MGIFEDHHDNNEDSVVSLLLQLQWPQALGA
jgi:hypothetical protein